MRKSTLLCALLERDGGRCGIHLGGCGELIDDDAAANIGHIYPQHLLQASDADVNSSLPPEGRQRLAQSMQSMSSAPLPVDQWLKDHSTNANVQPMHDACNEKMRGHFPPASGRLLPLCTCCSWWYALAHKTRAEGRLVKLQDAQALNTPNFADEHAWVFIRVFVRDSWLLAWGYVLPHAVSQPITDDIGRSTNLFTVAPPSLPPKVSSRFHRDKQGGLVQGSAKVEEDVGGVFDASAILATNEASRARHADFELDALKVVQDIVHQWHNDGYSTAGVMSNIARIT